MALPAILCAKHRMSSKHNTIFSKSPQNPCFWMVEVEFSNTSLVNGFYCFHSCHTYYERGRIALSSSESNSSSSSRETNILPPIIFTDKYLFARLLIFFLLTGKYSFCTSVSVKYFLLISFFSISFYLLQVDFVVLSADLLLRKNIPYRRIAWIW